MCLPDSPPTPQYKPIASAPAKAPTQATPAVQAAGANAARRLSAGGSRKKNVGVGQIALKPENQTYTSLLGTNKTALGA